MTLAHRNEFGEYEKGDKALLICNTNGIPEEATTIERAMRENPACIAGYNNELQYTLQLLGGVARSLSMYQNSNLVGSFPLAIQQEAYREGYRKPIFDTRDLPILRRIRRAIPPEKHFLAQVEDRVDHVKACVRLHGESAKLIGDELALAGRILIREARAKLGEAGIALIASGRAAPGKLMKQISARSYAGS